MNSIFKKLVTGTAVLALLMTAFASASLAATSEVTGGSLGDSGITATNFEAVTLDGTTQTVTAQINSFTITDATGSGAGWNVSVAATQFMDGTGLKPLAAGALGLAAPAVTLVEDNSDPISTITTSSGIIDNGVAVEILSAALNGGKGSYSIASIPMTLTLMPKEVYAGTYTSTITTSLTTGP
ncbi:WxL domain-containing protein [Paenisporosarcina sp. TG-14]|uniref:WxL domain-containing protein n=1 Tax=Paenisporosarcina sp. TG-14 TaxID=1231057 RepID=UPI00030FB1ED|nr:WxL domain-containing protein [Paenisporosarcina sp. TG-14]